MARLADTPIAPGDVAALSISPDGQPYVIMIAAVLAPGGFIDAQGVPDVERLRSALAARLDGVPELRLSAVERDGQWWWTDNGIDLPAHVNEIPESLAGSDFGILCGQLAMRPLDSGRPLWHLTLVPAARPGHCGLVLRIHHMLVDGARATAVLESLFSPAAPEGSRPASSSAAQPRECRASWSERLKFQINTVIRPRVRSHTLLGPLSQSRDAAVASVGLAALELGAHARGGTLNDAYLLAAAQGVRAVIEGGGEAPPETIAISVPVQVAGAVSSRNAVGFMLVDIPLAINDLTAAVRAVALQTEVAKRVARRAGLTFRSARVARWFNWFGLRQRMIGAIASNVRGPSQRLMVAGAPLVELWPLGPLAGNVRVGFTAVSYADQLWVGVEVDSGHTVAAKTVATRVQDVLVQIAEGHQTFL